MKRISFLLVLTALMTACAETSSTPTPSLAPISTGETPNALPEPTDPAQRITVKAGETFDIIVPSNSSTGYRWKTVDDLDQEILEFVGQDYIPERPIIPGSGGVDIWTFRGLRAGDTPITLGYYPPGNQDKPEETAVFSVTVE